MEFGDLKLEKCRHGWILFRGPLIGTSLELYGEYSESEAGMMAGYLRAGDTVIEVGANIGALTLPLAGMVGTAGRVYAIESHAGNFNVLCANLALNGIAQVRPLNAFVRAAPGSGTHSIAGKENFVDERWPAGFLALDDLGLEACALIKIDVDGREQEVLQSGARLIERARPVLYFENDLQALSAPLLRQAMDFGYELYWHLAPMFRADNFRGNPRDAWAPNRLVSPMVLGLPADRNFAVPDLDLIADASEWFR
jgi:FkbM family methyltransferase